MTHASSSGPGTILRLSWSVSPPRGHSSPLQVPRDELGNKSSIGNAAAWWANSSFIYGVWWGRGRERGGHCLLMNLRFVFLPGGRAGPLFSATVALDSALGLPQDRRPLQDEATAFQSGTAVHACSRAPPGPSPGCWWPARGLHPTLSRSPAPGLRRWCLQPMGQCSLGRKVMEPLQPPFPHLSRGE